MAPKTLRAVSDGETAPKAKPKTITQAETPRELLLAMKARVAEAVESPTTPARDLAALTKRLMEIVREIEVLDAKAEEEAKESDATPDDRWEAV